MTALLVLAKIVSAFGWVVKGKAAEGAGLVIVGWVWWEVRYWPGCWVRMIFVLRVGLRVGKVVAGTKKTAAA